MLGRSGLDMRESILTFIFIISEYSIITGGDGNCGVLPKIANAENIEIVSSRFRMSCTEGYVRQAGTSNLFRCANGSWINTPTLVCIRDPRRPVITTTQSTVTPTSIVPTKAHSKTTPPGKSTSTVAGKTVFTATHTVPWTSHQTSKRTTTTEETTATTSITPRITAASTTHNNVFTLSSHSPSGHSPANNVSDDDRSDRRSGSKTTTSITAGTLIFVIIAGLAVAILLLRRRSRLQQASGPSVEMKKNCTGSEHPLIQTHTDMNSRPPDSIQPPVTPFIDSP